MNLKDHEKFISFVLLGAALVAMAIMLYVKPIPDSATNSGVLQILNMIIGAIISGFGGATNALFRTSDQVKVTNQSDQPIPTTDSGVTDATTPPTTTPAADGELPETEKLNAIAG